MKHAWIRAELTAMLTDACAPARVVDEEPDTITDVTVVVAWTGSVRERDVWRHQYEERIVLPAGDHATAHFELRDRLVRAVAIAVDNWGPGPTYTTQRPALSVDTVTVGTTPTPAVICRHTVTEPPEMGDP